MKKVELSMKNLICFFLTFSITTILFSQEMKPLKPIKNFELPPDYVTFNKVGLNKTMPDINAVTLNEIKVDSMFFKDKVTVLNFSYIGCTPCMFEVNHLNQIYEKYKNQDVNIISVFSINRQGLLDFLNGNDIYKGVRKNVPFNNIKYTLIPECLGEKEDYRNGAKPQCNNISKYYGVKGYPKTVIIDKDRIVRHISNGFPMTDIKADSIKNEWVNIIDGLLK